MASRSLLDTKVDPIDYLPYPKLTKSFVAAHSHLGWRDLAWAVTNGWLDTSALAGLADDLAAGDEDLRAEAALAAMDDDELALASFLEAQAAKDPAPIAAVRKRWMDIAVAWVYQNRNLFDDPLSKVEEIWEAFDHPSELNRLIRWMPAPEGQPVGDAAMMDRWKSYVDVVENR
jgi:hypothetical protein